jgi:multidrug efflux pump subunit AcrA (membrane-fusion protein)
MKLKKIALRGMVILGVTVALCMFFANTIKTISTPKVQLVQASRGRLEQKIKLSTEVYFPDFTDYTLSLAAQSAIVVDKVYVRAGHHVEAGETLFTATLSSYDKDWDDLQTKYDEKAKALLDKDVENRKLNRTSTQNDLYDAVLATQSAMAEAEHDAQVLAYKLNVDIGADSALWQQKAAGQPDLVYAVLKAADAKEAYDAAYQAFFDSYLDDKIRVKSATFKFINERRILISDLAKIADDIVALSQRKEALSTVTAPQAGYVVAMNVKNGDAYDGKKVAFTLSADSAPPVLRGDITAVKKLISEGIKVEIAGDYGTLKTNVEKTALEGDGKKYAYITLTDDIITTEGGIPKMITDGAIEVTLTYRAKEATTLIPASAVRNEGEGEDYVYMVQYNYGGFLNSSSMKVIKTSVDVVERGDTMVSVQQDLSYQDIADREDRALTDGGTVMLYVD